MIIVAKSLLLTPVFLHTNGFLDHQQEVEVYVIFFLNALTAIVPLITLVRLSEASMHKNLLYHLWYLHELTILSGKPTI